MARSLLRFFTFVASTNQRNQLINWHNAEHNKQGRHNLRHVDLVGFLVWFMDSSPYGSGTDPRYIARSQQRLGFVGFQFGGPVRFRPPTKAIFREPFLWK